MKDRICEAIALKKRIQFRYEERIRVVEPHLLGRNAAEHDALSGYLARGYSESDHKPYWRLYLLRGIEQLVILDETFPGPRKGYNPKDKRMVKIYCRLELE
jgi:hypothetical protein